MTAKTNYTNRALLLPVRQGDHKAFTEIYSRYREKLFSVAGNKLNDLSLAEEWAQDIFLDLWNRRATLVVNGELGAGLAVAVKYKVIDARLKRSQAVNYRRSVRQHLSLADHSTEARLSFEELKDKLAPFVAKLPGKCQLVYKLSRQDGYSQKEIKYLRTSLVGSTQKNSYRHLQGFDRLNRQ